jgi:peptidoglycan/xylan/chitin deacetylase (PgdA/CDA1 family)
VKWVSPLLKRIVYPALSGTGCLRWLAQSGLAVITYHGVLPRGYDPIDPAFDGNLIRPEILGQQLRLLKAHYNVIAPEELICWRQGRSNLPPRAVLVTCDDGLLNCLTDMLPVLQQENVSCLFFVTGASAEKSRTMLWYEELFLLFLRAPAGPFQIADSGVAIEGNLRGCSDRRATWWSSVKRLSQIDATRRSSFLCATRIAFGPSAESDFKSATPAACRRFGLLTLSELRELASSGMTIGAHSMSHPMLSQSPPELAYAETLESRIKLEAALEKSIWAFAYPFGDPQSVTPQVLKMPQTAGYEAAFVNFGGGLGARLQPYTLPRIHVTAEMKLAELEAHLSGFYARLQRLAGRNIEGVEMMQT